jgi:hypothetical protein
MANVEMIHEVCSGTPGDWNLCFQWGDMFMMKVLHKQVTDLSGEDPTEAYRRREDKPGSQVRQKCFV